MNLVAVSLAEVKWSSSPEDVLVAYSLGSCVAVAMWDPHSGAGGMAHVVLPSSSGRTDAADAPGKYADTAVPQLLKELGEVSGEPSRMKVWMAGGAHVLKGIDLPGGDIGTANAKAVLDSLRALGFQEPNRDIGDDYGRTMRLYVGEGRATVYSVTRGEKEI